MKNAYKAAALTLMLLILVSVTALAEHRNTSTQPITVQDEEYVPYDQWYGPDESLDRVDDDIPESVVEPETPNTDERVAPEEDLRPIAR